MIVENLDKMIASAIKNGKHDELDVWRAIKTAFTNYKTAKAGNIITDEVEMQIIGKMIAQRKDSIEQYTNANRIDLAEKENNELNILKSLLPKEPTEKEIEDETVNAINSLISEKGNDYKISMKDMKDVMSRVKKIYPLVNGAIVSKTLKEKI